MTTREIIEYLQDNSALAGMVLEGVHEDKREAFASYYGIGGREVRGADYLAIRFNRSEATIYQWVNSVKLYLRNPRRIYTIKAYLKNKQRERYWFWRQWNRVRALWGNIKN